MTLPAQKPLRNYDNAELKRLDMALHLPPQSDYRAAARTGRARASSPVPDGCTITDAEGKSLLDGRPACGASMSVTAREELARVAYEQMLELPYYNSFFKTTTPPTVRLAAKVAEKMQIGNPDLTHVFFNASGSEAKDTSSAWSAITGT